ncbi:MAG: cytochrome b [Candidatus Nanopelagicales bacterium]
MSTTESKATPTAYNYVDSRVGFSAALKRNLRKVFPDHWSFMLGEIALYSFIILLLTGVFLTFWYKPSMTEVIYNGSYIPLKGVPMSEAFASTLEISFDVRGGMLIRQIHHWAALFFVAAMMVHLMRVFFTGAYRKPREFNWLLGIGLLTLGLLEGFAGYSLPDDLLSGIGLRIASGIVQALPVIGTWALYFLFGGEFPGVDFIPRLYTIHVLLVPGIILALVTAHLLLVWTQKHTQYPGPGRTENNVVGYPLLPVYTAKAGGFFFIVFGVTTLMGALITINPIWLYGPFTPDQVTAGSQPDFYIGFLEGSLRVMPAIEFNIFNTWTFSPNVLIPALILPGLMMTAMALYPFIESWVTGDKREHNLLDRPRNAPTRTALGTMSLSFYLLLWLGGGNDIIATTFQMSINAITWFMRAALIIVPPIVFIVTRRICLGLQRNDLDKLLHGKETGRILRLPDGGFVEVHEPVSEAEIPALIARETYPRWEIPMKYDENGIKTPKYRRQLFRAKLSHWWTKGDLPIPTIKEIQAGQHHAHEALEQAQSFGVEPGKEEIVSSSKH